MSSTIVRRHPVVVFCVLLAVVSWPVQVFMPGSAVLTLVGPSVCAFVVTYLAQGREGVRALWRRVLRWRVPVRFYVVALVGLGATVLAVAYAVTAVFFPADLAPPSVPVLLSTPINFVLIFVLAGLGEEFGWRGFALPRLQERHGSVRASVVVGLLWAVWHYPKILVEYGGPTATLAWFTVGVVAASVVYAWLFDATGGSVLLVALMHAAENTWTGLPFREVFSFVPPGFAFFDAVRECTFVLMAVAVVLLAGRRPPRGDGSS
ncbi:CPBP family intramembrane glutamic endopeptidase [Pseudonocardia humida]|uniref:CPBP family intramembrane metalloprotease n=1 Tax=Pseudonocardia humida TaxID=2800819 RepID=A0ABT1A0T8_9PSEU|nr:CPBP family intramembrane glutamic endopeptidase [Pseudonocardia humida]MCO1656504.1 CPBP family intramembrane metalloprotease [Pseudonocardia humida]